MLYRKRRFQIEIAFLVCNSYQYILKIKCVFWTSRDLYLLNYYFSITLTISTINVKSVFGGIPLFPLSP
ncbi:MAG: hypothetical protein ACJARX_002086 [Psychroserpens sp.]|jgi:hypothetical protein